LLPSPVLRLVKNGTPSSLTLFEPTVLTSKSTPFPTGQVTEKPSEQKKHADNIEGEIVNSTLSQILLATEEKLGRSVEIHAIAYPQHFQTTPYVLPLYNTAMKLVPGFNNFLQMGPYLYYIKFTYGLNTSQALGYPPETKLSDYNALLLHIDYNKDFLEVSIMEVGEDISIRDRVFRIDNFGGSENIASVRKQTHQESLGN
jgi:hypothetical protein